MISNIRVRNTMIDVKVKGKYNIANPVQIKKCQTNRLSNEVELLFKAFSCLVLSISFIQLHSFGTSLFRLLLIQPFLSLPTISDADCSQHLFILLFYFFIFSSLTLIFAIQPFFHMQIYDISRSRLASIAIPAIIIRFSFIISVSSKNVHGFRTIINIANLIKNTKLKQFIFKSPSNFSIKQNTPQKLIDSFSLQFCQQSLLPIKTQIEFIINHYPMQRPYVFYTNDNYFYIKSRKPLLPSSFLKINRFTSKILQIDQQQFTQQTHRQKMTRQEIFLIMGILVVNQQPYLCIVQEVQPVATLNNDKVLCIRKVEYIPYKHKFLYRSINQAENEKILQEMSENVINGNFYFCYGLDLTLTHQKTLHKKPTQRKYFWNQSMLGMFAYYKLPMCWRIPVIQGHVKQIYCENNYFSFYFCQISRRSKHMSGTRFNSRGIDTNCNSSNFVETEEIFICHNYLFSHVSLRGSVPIFWEQAEFGAQIKFSHTDQENGFALEKHYQFLKKEYQSNIITVNLLSAKKSPQKQLKNRFQFYLYKALPNQPYIFYDFHEQIKQSQNQNKIIDSFIKSHTDYLCPEQNFLCIDRYTNKIYRQQAIVTRINCLDCIDRTNVVMSRTGVLFLEQVMRYINTHTNMEEKKLNFGKEYLQEIGEVWVDLGNRISMIYCGTESIASHLIKKQQSSFFSFFTGGIKSINRYYNANVNDGMKQTCIDFLLGRKQELSKTKFFEDNITNNVIEQTKYCSYEEASIYILTWNCNTVDPQKLTQKDKEKLFNFPVDKTDIIIVCLQQMVQLNSFNVLIGSNDNIVEYWRKIIESYLHDITANTNKSYSYLTCHDMVGVAMLVFVSGTWINRISMHEWKEVKTGFKNNLGNKGAIILFMQIDSTYMTLMNCHLAAGQTSASERMQDLQYIHNDGLNQREKRRLFDKSQYRFFIGDMNFRLQAKNEHVRQILYTIQKMDAQKKLTKSDIQTYLQTLLQKDEYYLSNKSGILSMYKQGTIYFLPTYKYVKKQKIYDTKRTPSWCDRILFYSKNEKKIVIIKYWDIDCYQSDHKPVSGAFKVLIKKEDADLKNKLIQYYMEKVE